MRETRAILFSEDDFAMVRFEQSPFDLASCRPSLMLRFLSSLVDAANG